GRTVVTRLGDQRQVRRDRVVIRGAGGNVIWIRRREVIGRRARASGGLASYGIDAGHGPVGRFSLHFGFAVAELPQVTHRHQVQPVTGGAHFLVHLVATLELRHVPL